MPEFINQFKQKTCLRLKSFKIHHRDLNGEKYIGTFYEQVQQKTKQNTFGIEKVIKKKGKKMYIKWKGYQNLFDSSISKPDIS